MRELIIGIEIGGSKLQLAVGTTEGELITVVQDPVDVEKGANGILDWLTENLITVRNQAAGSPGKVIAIGCGFGGPINRKAGRVLKSNQIMGWD